MGRGVALCYLLCPKFILKNLKYLKKIIMKYQQFYRNKINTSLFDILNKSRYFTKFVKVYFK